MKPHVYSNSQIINGIALGFSLCFFIASFIAAHYTGEWGHVFYQWYLILITPCPLVTDYFNIGGLSSAFLNAGACGLSCSLFMILLKGESRANTLAGYFLVVAHCFYGLNFLNMWPCLLSPFIYLHYKRLDFKKNFHVCMFATSFSPFISEFLFRYTQGDSFVFGQPNLTVLGVILAILCSIMLGYIVPAILPGAQAWHKGYNLYNGGLAFGLFGFFLYNFMYRTMGLASHSSVLILPKHTSAYSIPHTYYPFSVSAAVLQKMCLPSALRLLHFSFDSLNICLLQSAQATLFHLFRQMQVFNHSGSCRKIGKNLLPQQTVRYGGSKEHTQKNRHQNDEHKIQINFSCHFLLSSSAR